jgi:hypothetical protein
MPDDESRLDRFRKAAGELETDDDPESSRERPGKLVKDKPVEKPVARPE